LVRQLFFLTKSIGPAGLQFVGWTAVLFQQDPKTLDICSASTSCQSTEEYKVSSFSVGFIYLVLFLFKEEQKN
jgi:hypothetical protein